MTSDASDRGQLIETDAAMRSLDRKIAEAVTQFVADQSQKLAEVERKRDRLVQELIKAQSKTDRTQLKAPIAGTVQQLAVNTTGQVVASGQALLTIVPLDSPIEIEAMIANSDIGFVAPGQPAVVKVEAFPFTRYGSVAGHVAKVSRDAVDERDATNLSDAANAAKPQSGGSGQPAKTQNLVFPATITLAQRTLDIDGKPISLTAGMAVTVEIKTGQRRAIDYLLSPLREVTTQAARER
jgi:hemolysin D